MKTSPVHLQTVAEKDKNVLSKLLYDYQLELLPYGNESSDEIKNYKYLPDYFTDPERSAFFIMVDDAIGGFVLVNTHTIIERDAHSIAEFYVAPAFRHSGVGEKAAALAFMTFPGRWEVAQMEANEAAIQFWRKAINRATKSQYKETQVATKAWHGPVQTFDAA
jgi:predicted acetyltransferase